MTWSDHVHAAVDAVWWGNRPRTMLALVGIVTGTGAIVAAISIGEGARRQALDEIGALGLDAAVVRAPDGVTERELAALRGARVRTVEATGLRRVRTTLMGGSTSEEVTRLMVSEPWLRFGRLRIARGRPMLPLDDVQRRRVAWITEALAARIHTGVGDEIRVGGVAHVVVGLVGSDLRGSRVSGLGVDLDAVVITPLDGSGAFTDVVLISAATDAGALRDVALAVLVSHGWPASRYEVIVPRELLAARLRAERGLSVMVFAIGLLALVAGGAGIMNLMLADVMARVTEIGVRRAVGARARDIGLQFVAEASVVAVAGALLGATAGVLFSVGCRAIADWPTSVSVGSLMLGVGVALATTLAFAVYPALRAAGLAPAAAIRMGE
jgi:putative ABC transport system permease protein